MSNKSPQFWVYETKNHDPNSLRQMQGFWLAGNAVVEYNWGMGEVIRAEPIESEVPEPEKERPELRDLPESVRELFGRLSWQVQDQIFPPADQATSGGASMNSLEEYEKKLNDMLASFDAKTREEFMAHCLAELVHYGRFRESFPRAFRDGNLSDEISALMNHIWQSRGKKSKDMLSFNDEYYQNFFAARATIKGKIVEKKAEIESLNVSIEKTRKQKRLTERKINVSREKGAELRALEKELDDFDFKHGNARTDFYRQKNLAVRAKKEWEWTVATVATSEYLDAAEFATVFGEQLEAQVFSVEKALDKNPEIKLFGFITPDAQRIEQVRQVLKTVRTAVEKWYQAHQDDPAFKKTAPVRVEERQKKLIEYFQTLVDSYLYGKRKLGKTDQDQVVNIKSMEVALNILNQKADR